jgi:hypothetical protein
MLEKADAVMTWIEHIEVLIGQALALNNRSKGAKRARQAVLLTAAQMLQAEIIKAKGGHPSG